MNHRKKNRPPTGDASRRNKPHVKKKRNFLFGLFKQVVFYALIVGVLIGIGVSTYLIILSQDLRDVNVLKNPVFDLPTVIYDRNGSQVYELYIEKQIVIKKENIPDVVRKALIAIEDSRFYSHTGIDLIRIVKAAYVNFKAGKIVEGASTITQQTAKLFFLTPERSFKRKIMEALLALKIEKAFEKDEIIELYLNKAYFGRHSRGIEAASLEFFSKPSKQLSVNEAALLIGLLKAPSSLSPSKNPTGALKRRNVVLSAMQRNGFISAEEYEIYSQKKLGLAPGKINFYPEAEYYVDVVRQFLKRLGKTDVTTAGYQVHTFMDIKMQIQAREALRKGLEDLQKRKGWPGKAKNIAIGDDIPQSAIDKTLRGNTNETGEIVTGVFTSVGDSEAEIILSMNEYGYINVKGTAWALSKKGNTLKSVFKFGDVAQFKVHDYDVVKSALSLSLHMPPESNGGIVAMNPHNGEVYAVVGGYRFSESQFNRVIQSNRQTGSAFKPILYATALENGYTLSSILNDNPYSSEEEDSTWRPDNYGRKFSGFLTFRDSLVYSKNVPTVRLLVDLGLSPLFNSIGRLGIEKKKFPRDFSIALGSASLTPEELTRAYAVFANGGYSVDAQYIKKIIDRNGRVLFDAKTPHRETATFVATDGTTDGDNPDENEGGSTRVFSPETSFLITSVLQDVIKRGTGRKAASIGRPAAGKTGTTNNYSDAWFVGYIPQLIAGVFIGNDIPSVPLGDREAGGRAALPVWLDFMKNAAARFPIENFKQPPGIITVKINPKTGYLICGEALEEERFEFFKPGTEPTQCDNGFGIDERTIIMDNDSHILPETAAREEL